MGKFLGMKEMTSYLSSANRRCEMEERCGQGCRRWQRDREGKGRILVDKR